MKNSTLHFQNKIISQPWHGTGAKVRPIIASMLQAMRADRPEEDVFGDPLPKMQIMGDVAVIPISGVLMIAVPDWAKQWGLSLTDANDIEKELTQAVNNPAVSMVVLDSDSPGGWSIAGDKLFEIVEAAASIKPVFGWVADGADCCSSAYEALAPSRAILAGRQACAIGCIGTYLALCDDSEFWKMMGITFEVFRSGDMKGIGEDSLTDSQRAWLQSTVDASGANFRANVKKYRTAIPDAEMQGQYYSGADAAAHGFIGGTARDLATAIAKFRRMI